MADLDGFSIHDWIEGSKTLEEAEHLKEVNPFQYPRLDRRVENLLCVIPFMPKSLFQYPRLDRRVENQTSLSDHIW